MLLVLHDVDPVEDQVVLPGLRIHDDDKDDDNDEDNGDDNGDDDYSAEHQVVLPGLRNQDGKQHAYYKRSTLSRSQSLSCNSSRACSIP